MRARLSCWLVLLLLISQTAVGPRATPALAANPQAGCAPGEGTGAITGKVTAANGGAPQNLVLVTAYTIYGEHVRGAYTNTSGVYTIDGLIGGKYILAFQPDRGSLKAEWSGNQPTEFTATAEQVTDGATTSGVNAALEAGGQFSGLIQNADGSAAIFGVRVRVYDAAGVQVASGNSNSSGNYTTVPGLPNGAYRIHFGALSGYLSEFYNDKATLQAAEPQTISGPGTVFNINARLARGATLSGTVTAAADGGALRSIRVTASGDDSFGSGVTDAAGRYTITGLRSGSHIVTAFSDRDPAPNLVRQQRSATVQAPETTSNIDFALAPGGTLTGRVTANGAALKDVSVRVFSSANSYNASLTTNATGVYTATGMPSGHYSVSFRKPDYIEEDYNDRIALAGTGVDLVRVSDTSTVTGIDAALSVGASVRGRVTDAGTDQPLRGVFIEVLDTRGSRVESTFSASDGTYATGSTLPSGAYTVRFSPDGRNSSCAYVTEYYANQPSSSSATPLTLTAPNAASNIDAALVRGSIIFGTVTDATIGTPISRGTVQVYDQQGNNVTYGHLTRLGGYHTYTALPSGNYRIKFSDDELGYLDEFYTDKPTLDRADPVTLTAPTDLFNVDAALAMGGLIAGQVRAADSGQPLRDGSVRVYDRDGRKVAETSSAEDGSYTVREGLPSGLYTLSFEPYIEDEAAIRAPFYARTYFGQTLAATRAQPITVSAGSTTANVDIRVLYGLWLPDTRR